MTLEAKQQVLYTIIQNLKALEGTEFAVTKDVIDDWYHNLNKVNTQIASVPNNVTISSIMTVESIKDQYTYSGVEMHLAVKEHELKQLITRIKDNHPDITTEEIKNDAEVLLLKQKIKNFRQAYETYF